MRSPLDDGGVVSGAVAVAVAVETNRVGRGSAMKIKLSKNSDVLLLRPVRDCPAAICRGTAARFSCATRERATHVQDAASLQAQGCRHGRRGPHL
jgi:hypothetical protein